VENPRPFALSGVRQAGQCLALLALVATGCVTTGVGPWFPMSKCEPAPPTQVVCTWKNSVAFLPDFTHNGQPAPALVGRVYLFVDESLPPVFCEGTLTVLVWPEGCDDPKKMEATILNPEDFKRLGKADTIGPGYTVVVPWSLYDPTVSKICIRTAFQRGNEIPLFTENRVTLARDNGVIHERHTPISVQRPGNMTSGAPAPPIMPTRIPIR
jgi:hypothetical protein